MIDRSPHLSNQEIAEMAEREGETRTNPHLRLCDRCRARVARATRLEHALYALPRTRPDAALVERILRALPLSRPVVFDWRPVWIGLATAAAVLLLVVLAHETASELQSNGAWEFVSTYTSQPEIMAAYPDEAFGALWETLPMLELGLTLAALVVTLYFVHRFWILLHLAAPAGSRRKVI